MKNRNELTYKIGRRVAYFRKQRKWSQDDLAETSGKIVNTISKIERGLGDPQISSLDAIAKALNMELADLISEAEHIPAGYSPLFDKVVNILKKENDNVLESVLKFLDILAQDKKK